MHKVTVLMPIFNVEKYIGEAIKSILTQSFTDLELLIINDGSTDKTANLVRKYKDKRIKFINNKKNRGLVAVLNQGMKLIKSRYLVRMDGDDISLPTRIEKQVQFMESHPEIDVCGTWFEVFESGAKSKTYSRPVSPAACKASLLFTDPVCHATTIMRFETLKKHDVKYSPGFEHLEDYEFWNRISPFANFSNIDEVLYRYRYHSDSTGHKEQKEQQRLMKMVQEIYLKKLGILTASKDVVIHSQILNRSYKPSILFLIRTGLWFRKLIKTNQKSRIYDDVEFSKIINQKWLMVCSDCTGGYAGIIRKIPPGTSIYTIFVRLTKQFLWRLTY